MKELSLPELKEIELNLLKVFHSFCVEHNITYYLSHGTLLGAIRYKKFIPWDDDVDLLIPRADYDRLLTLFIDSERYQLFSYEKNPKYGFPFAKLCDMSTKKDECGYDNGVTLGVDIDIFPLDAWNGNLKKAKKEVRYLRKKMFFLGLSKKKNISNVSFMKKIVLKVVITLCKTLGSQYYIKKIIEASNTDNQNDSNYLGCKAWCVYGERGIIPAEVFAETIDVEFEGEMFPAPKDYDTYLTCLYGDYLPEPPKEKQKTHHTFKAYRL